jgi:hypothetical protein
MSFSLIWSRRMKFEAKRETRSRARLFKDATDGDSLPKRQTNDQRSLITPPCLKTKENYRAFFEASPFPATHVDKKLKHLTHFNHINPARHPDQ